MARDVGLMVARCSLKQTMCRPTVKPIKMSMTGISGFITKQRKMSRGKV